MSSVIVAKASVIIAFKFVISETGVENTSSLTYPNKKSQVGVISGDRGGQGVGPSLPIRLFGNIASKNQMLQQTHDKKKSREVVISGDRGGQGVGPSLPIHLFGNVASKTRC